MNAPATANVQVRSAGSDDLQALYAAEGWAREQGFIDYAQGLQS